MSTLLAHALALEAEGLSTYILSGGYTVPTPTLTGDVVTANPAQLFGLSHKGRIAVGGDADVILLDEHLGVRDVYARGRELVHDGELVERGVFDS